MPKQVKYGYLFGPRCIIKGWPIAASQNFEQRSGKFVKLDSSDDIDIADSGPADTLGETCDLIVTSNIQYADIGESTEDVIAILDLDTTDDTVDVRMNPSKMYAAGVA